MSSNCEDISPVMRFWHKLFHPYLGDSWRAGAPYSFSHKSKALPIAQGTECLGKIKQNKSCVVDRVIKSCSYYVLPDALT